MLRSPTREIMPDVIASLEQLTPERLTRALEASGILPVGHVTAVEPGPVPDVGSLVVPLLLTYSPEAPQTAPPRLILKLPHRTRRKNGWKEVSFYTTVAAQMTDPPTVRCYEAVFDAETERFHLLLEDLSASHWSHPASVLPPTQPMAEGIIVALAQLHAAWWGHPHLGQHIGTRPDETSLAAELALAQQHYPAFADFLGDRLSATRRAWFEKLLAGLLPRLVQRLAPGQHLTLFHGDPHIGNFLYPHDSTQERVRILDWKSWDIGLGVADLAHMLAVYCFPERRARLEVSLLRQYHHHLLALGVASYPWEACWEDYRLCVARYLLFPLRQWTAGRPDYLWWHHLERLLLAFEELGCEAL
jgi:hypothetical protein